jgi:hypothetical protein
MQKIFFEIVRISFVVYLYLVLFNFFVFFFLKINYTKNTYLIHCV